MTARPKPGARYAAAPRGAAWLPLAARAGASRQDGDRERSRRGGEAKRKQRSDERSWREQERETDMERKAQQGATTNRNDARADAMNSPSCTER